MQLIFGQCVDEKIYMQSEISLRQRKALSLSNIQETASCYVGRISDKIENLLSIGNWNFSNWFDPIIPRLISFSIEHIPSQLQHK